eukprot:Nitzschia sp. Nitz4//scaffold56_size114212//105851//107254//NITZ4_003971-RA/size114212-processed-gene-0.40-mRNA-1//-1//CDS//3329554769//7676//frame0
MERASVATGSSNARPSRKARRPKSRRLDQRFRDYIWFGLYSTVCMALFVGCYALILIVIWPLLAEESPDALSEELPQDYIKNMHLPPALKQVADHDKEIVSEMAGAVKQRLRKWRQGRGTTDAALLDQAVFEFDQLKKEENEEKAAVEAKNAVANHAMGAVAGGSTDRLGFIVLGMHRSGTSMLSGLLHTSCGYEVGGPLIGSAFDNEKGFFERIDVVLQNDEFMKAQKVWWSANVINYDWEKGVQDKNDGVISFQNGKPGLEFFNNPKNAPWLQKDPRMCITLKTWLALMNNEPAVLFTYRHPLEVAMSLKRRENDFSLEKGLRLWIIYNMRAIQNSKGLCVVHSSNQAILANPMTEIQRISDELTSKCHVPEPPYRLKQEDVDKFIDPSLQHNKNQREKDEQNKEVIATYNDGKCIVRAYETETEEGSAARTRETKLYGWAMKIYCDFESGKAYDDDYEWPDLPK